jgi:hypothetical protein
MSGIRTSVPCSRHMRLLTHEWARAQLVTIGYTHVPQDLTLIPENGQRQALTSLPSIFIRESIW